MKVLVAYSDKAHYFIAIYVESDEFVLFRVFAHDDLCEWLTPFANKIHMGVPNSEIGKRQVPEFAPLVEHVHCCVKPTFYVILDIVGSNANFVHKAGKLGARASRINGGHYVVIEQTKSYV